VPEKRIKVKTRLGSPYKVAHQRSAMMQSIFPTAQEEFRAKAYGSARSNHRLSQTPRGRKPSSRASTAQADSVRSSRSRSLTTRRVSFGETAGAVGEGESPPLPHRRVSLDPSFFDATVKRASVPGAATGGSGQDKLEATQPLGQTPRAPGTPLTPRSQQGSRHGSKSGSRRVSMLESLSEEMLLVEGDRPGSKQGSKTPRFRLPTPPRPFGEDCPGMRTAISRWTT